MRKGQQTRAAIVNAALAQASRTGLEGLTIGALAEQMQMSKSGVFAHFGSREDLQIAVLKAYEQRFIDEILKPSLRRPRGLPRLVAVLDRWLDRTVIEASLGCIWISGASEYDDRPGAVREELVSMVRGWQQEVTRAIEQSIRERQLDAATDVQDLVFGLYGVILVLHHDARLMHSTDALPRARRMVERLLQPHLSAAAQPLFASLRATLWPAGAASSPAMPACAVSAGRSAEPSAACS